MAAALLFHKRECGADGVSGAVNINFHHSVELIIGNIFKIISGTDAGAVDQYIGYAESFDGELDLLQDIIVVCHVN